VIDRVPDDLRFRSLAAPGLDEDDLFVAMWGLPARGLWGEGRPPSRAPADEPWDEAAERRRRHVALMRKWDSGAGPRAATSPPT
jgi:hypothetical protein